MFLTNSLNNSGILFLSLFSEVDHRRQQKRWNWECIAEMKTEVLPTFFEISVIFLCS